MPSTVISSISYDAPSSTLRITFVSGMIYDYKNVPKNVYQALKTSGAKGVYLNQHVKGKYLFEKIKWFCSSWMPKSYDFNYMIKAALVNSRAVKIEYANC